MKDTHFLFIHGFLGHACDWDLFKQNLLSLSNDISLKNIFTLDLVSDFENATFEEVIKRVHRLIHIHTAKQWIVVGYSLGGRLSLQLLKSDPALIQSFVFISTHPGLRSSEERVARRQTDEEWAEQIETAEWSVFVKNWKHQSVFENDHPQVDPYYLTLSDVSTADRQKLSRLLSNTSLAEQENFTDLIHANSDKILWVTGERDMKFTSLSYELTKSAKLNWVTVPKAGHRLPLTHPLELSKIVHNHLKINNPIGED